MWGRKSALSLALPVITILIAPCSGSSLCQSGRSFTISSYNGTVIVGIACDTTLVPDHESIVDGFAGAFERLVDATPDLPG